MSFHGFSYDIKVNTWLLFIFFFIVIRKVPFRFFFSNQAGCVTEAQNWEKMIKTTKAESMESVWCKEV